MMLFSQVRQVLSRLQKVWADAVYSGPQLGDWVKAKCRSPVSGIEEAVQTNKTEGMLMLSSLVAFFHLIFSVEHQSLAALPAAGRRFLFQ